MQDKLILKEVDETLGYIKTLSPNKQLDLLSNTPSLKIPCTKGGMITFIRFINTVMSDLKVNNKPEIIELGLYSVMDVFTTKEGNMEVNGVLLEELSNVSKEFLTMLTKTKIKSLVELYRVEPVLTLVRAINKFYYSIN